MTRWRHWAERERCLCVFGARKFVSKIGLARNYIVIPESNRLMSLSVEGQRPRVRLHRCLNSVHIMRFSVYLHKTDLEEAHEFNPRNR